MKKLLSLILFGVFSLSAGASAVKASPEDVKSFINSIGNQVVELFNSGLSEEEKKAGIEPLMKEHLDLAGIAKVAAGAIWRKMSADQKEEYRALMFLYGIQEFSNLSSTYNVKKFAIARVHSRKRFWFVSMKVETFEGKEVEMRWRLIEDIDQNTGDVTFKILDVEAGGVSILLTIRGVFKDIAGKEGIEGLLKTLKELSSQDEAS